MSVPKSLEQAVQSRDCTFIGGGTDIMPLLKNHVRNDSNFLLVSKLPELQGIAE